MLQTYVTANEIVNSNKQVQSNCNSIIFYNIGSTTVIIDQLVLPQGCSWTIDGNKDEINISFYNVSFLNDGANPSLCITRKIVEQHRY